MKNGVNENVLILTTTFSCAISVNEEEVTIKKPSREQQYIEQIIIQAEQQAYQETLIEYKHKSISANFICDIPGFEDTFQHKLDSFIEPYGVLRVSEESLSILPLISPFTSGLNINAPIIYTSSHCSIINARCMRTTNHKNASSSAIGNAVNIPEAVGIPVYFNHTALEIDIFSSGNFTTVMETKSATNYSNANFTGVSINENGISLNITTAFNTWNKASIKH